MSYSTTYSSSYQPFSKSLRQKPIPIPFSLKTSTSLNNITDTSSSNECFHPNYCHPISSSELQLLTNSGLEYTYSPNNNYPVIRRVPLSTNTTTTTTTNNNPSNFKSWLEYNSDPMDFRTRLKRLDCFPCDNLSLHQKYVRDKNYLLEDVSNSQSNYTSTLTTTLGHNDYSKSLFDHDNSTRPAYSIPSNSSPTWPNSSNTIKSRDQIMKTDSIPSRSSATVNSNRTLNSSGRSLNIYTVPVQSYQTLPYQHNHINHHHDHHHNSNNNRNYSINGSYRQIFNQIARINGHLYLSSLNALSPDRLRNLGITLLVSAVLDPVPLYLRNAVTSSMHISVEDIESANLRVHFDRVTDRIALENKRGGRALVHCIAGISRSSSLVMAYLMRFLNMSLSDAYRHVKEIRGCIQPNPGFWHQLIDYEEHLRGSRSMRVSSASKEWVNRLREMGIGNDTRLTRKPYPNSTTYSTDRGYNQDTWYIRRLNSG